MPILEKPRIGMIECSAVVLESSDSFSDTALLPVPACVSELSDISLKMVATSTKLWMTYRNSRLRSFAHCR